MIRTGFNDNYDDKWGRFTPEQRFNVDQSPCPFALNPKRTYHLFEDGVNQQQDKVWIAQPGSGLDKRQCSLQVCVRPVGSQPCLGIIFRGKGKRISDAERNSYHKSVDVFFQENAWADTRSSVEWVGRTLNPCVEELDRYVLYCDISLPKHPIRSKRLFRKNREWRGTAFHKELTCGNLSMQGMPNF